MQKDPTIAARNRALHQLIDRTGPRQSASLISSWVCEHDRTGWPVRRKAGLANRRCHEVRSDELCSCGRDSFGDVGSRSGGTLVQSVSICVNRQSSPPRTISRHLFVLALSVTTREI